MSTVQEIEKAIQKLPPETWIVILLQRERSGSPRSGDLRIAEFMRGP